MTITILAGIALTVAGIIATREAFRRRDPREAAHMGSVSQTWVAEHRVGRTDDGLR